MTATLTVTPVQSRGGRLYKREDLHRHPSGVNGGKWRQCQWLIGRLAAAGHTEVASGASVLSPQLAMTAVACAEAGLGCDLYVGTSPERAVLHPSPALAVSAGARLHQVKVAYNPALQAAVRRRAADTGAGILRYGVAPAPDAGLEELRAFHWLGGTQALALAGELPALPDLIVPFGSGNSAASILWGLAHARPADLPWRIHLIGIGPSRWDWLWRRLADLGLPPATLGGLQARCRHHDLHAAGLVTYTQRRPYTADGIVLHPTYEGKVAAWLDTDAGRRAVPGWAARDDSALLWIVGGPL
jgi:hypothetical protein